MKRMLFNATQQEELRVAIVDGQRLIDIDIESNSRELHKSNIYKAVITRIEPSLEACFVNYGEDRHGFLPFKEVARSLFNEGVNVRSASIREALTEGREIMVQVEKEERGNKGAALTTFISLAGRYLVLMPNNPRGGGVSRRIEGEERQELRTQMDKLDVPPGMSIIARTAGIGRSLEELQWDLNYLLALWNAIESAGTSAPGAFLIYQESSLVIRAIRDYFTPDIGEILIDTDEIYEQAKQFMSYVMPDMVNRVKRYRDSVPLFSRFQIEHQIESAYSRTVSLPSGGSIVIDHTEALVAIDVNSARSTRGTDIETTAFTTNCEAAEEVARQLRLRDLGGLIVIDFIDMELAKNRREIELRLKEALHYDRARVQMEKITRFGLMELSRQRLRPSLSEGSHITCPRCNGTGHIRDTESSALQVLRVIEEESMKESSALIHVQIPVDVAAFLLNEKRNEIFKVEQRHRVDIVLIPNKHLETPHYTIERIKHDDPRLDEPKASYKLADAGETDMGYDKTRREPPKPSQEAIVKNIPEGLPAPTPVVPAPAPVAEEKPAEKPAEPASEGGFFASIMSLFGIGSSKKEEAKPAEETKESDDKPSRRQKNMRERRGRRRGDRGERGDRAERTERAEKSDKPEADTEQQDKREPEIRGRKQVAPRPQDKDRPGDDAAEEALALTAPSGDELAPTEEEIEKKASRRRQRGRRRDNTSEKAIEMTDAAGLSGEEFSGAAASIPAPAVKAENKDGDREPRRRDRQRGRGRRRGERDQKFTPLEVNLPAKLAGPLVIGLEPVAETPVWVEEKPSPAHVAAMNEALDDAQAPVVTDVAPLEVPAAPVPRSEEPAGGSVSDPGFGSLDIADISPAPATDTAVNVENTLTVHDTVAVSPAPAETVVETATDALVSAPVSVSEPADTAIPAVEPVATTNAVAETPVAKTVEDLKDVLAKAGLEMAATDPSKIVAVPVPEEPVRRPRRPRQKVVIDDGPLIQVDTKKD